MGQFFASESGSGAGVLVQLNTGVRAFFRFLYFLSLSLPLLFPPSSDIPVIPSWGGWFGLFLMARSEALDTERVGVYKSTNSSRSSKQQQAVVACLTKLSWL